MLASSQPVPPSRRRFQFTLRTALAAILLAAVAVSLWLSNKQAVENRRLQAENEALHERMQNELGELEINDSNQYKLQAISIPTFEPMTWKWRVYIPAAKKFYLHNISQGVSDDNRPQNGSFAGPLAVGEQIMIVSLQKDLSKENEWKWVVRCGGSEFSPHLIGKNAEWINRRSLIAANQAGIKLPLVVDADKPLELFRFRSFADNGKGVSATGVGDGILVWIQDNAAVDRAAAAQKSTPADPNSPKTEAP